MKGIFNFIRWIIGLLLSLVLALVLILSIILSTFSLTLTDRRNLKSWLKASTLYDNAKGLVIEMMLQAPNTDENGNVIKGDSFYREMGKRLENPKDDFGKLINKLITAQFLENTVTTIIDATYDWMESKTDKLTFSVKLVNNKEDMVEFLAITFREKVKALPACSKSYHVTPSFDPLGTSCWPRGMSYSEVNKFIDKNSNRPEFQTLMDKLGLSSDLLNIPTETTAKVQLIFKLVYHFPVLMLVVILILALVCYVIIPAKKAASLIIGVNMLMVGIAWLYVALSGIMSSEFVLSNIPLSMKSEQFVLFTPYLQLFVRAMMRSLLKMMYINIAIVLALGIGFVGLGVKGKRGADRDKTKVVKEIKSK